LVAAGLATLLRTTPEHLDSNLPEGQ
jgi:hypothetical protein